MKPYYQDDWVTIYHGDCREILPDLDKVDLVLTDPPYNTQNIGPNQRVYEGSVMKLSSGEYGSFCSNWYNLVNQKADTIVFTPGIGNTHNYPQPKWQLCWHKPASVSFNRMGGFNTWEPVFIYGNTKHVRLGQDYLLYNTLNSTKGVEKEHPCPKPVSLWQFLANKFSGPDSLILDPFLGSGTTAYCAKKLNRKCIGIEIEKKYCEIAAKRCSQSVMSLNL
ncbi:Modification methylase DpnIIB [subsurface metagenome]